MSSQSPPNTRALIKRARSAWYAMRKRCLNPKAHAWDRYGGAGITICPQWATFDQFLKDMGQPPTADHWLGRKDVKGHYTPSNCVWTLPDQQQRRRAFCHRVHLQDGSVLTAAEAARLPGMPKFWGVRNRLRRGYSLELPQPARVYRASKWITWQGQTLPTPEWARRLGVRPYVLWQRLSRGMPLAQAMTPGLMRHRSPQNPKPPTSEEPKP